MFTQARGIAEGNLPRVLTTAEVDGGQRAVGRRDASGYRHVLLGRNPFVSSGYYRQTPCARIARIKHELRGKTACSVRRGWSIPTGRSKGLPACRRAPDGMARARAYARLQRGLHFYQQWVCLPFDEAVAAIFDQLRTQKFRLGTNDLAIAAITLAVRGILVTRNTVDFSVSLILGWRTGRDHKPC
jgi:hypothetical protein